MIKPSARMYLILREDLAYKYIQGGHVLAQFALENVSKFEDWNNRHLICLSVFNGSVLFNLETKLRVKFKTDFPELHDSVSISRFIEPDLESDLPTALCIYENGTGEVSEALKDLRLASK